MTLSLEDKQQHRLFKALGVVFVLLAFITIFKPVEANAQPSDAYWNDNSPYIEGTVYVQGWISRGVLGANFGVFRFDNGHSASPNTTSAVCADHAAYGDTWGSWPLSGSDCRFRYFYEKKQIVVDTTSIKETTYTRFGGYWTGCESTQRLLIKNCDFPGYTEENTKDIIVSFYGADGWWEDGGHDASWLWENGKTSGEYYHKTDPNKTVDTVNLVTSLWKIHKKNYYNIAGKLLNSEYWSEPTKQFKKTITYDYSSAINQTKYSPYNLNRNGLATTSDISSTWVGNTKLDVTLDNEQGVTDNSLLKTLDVNADSNFKFKFNNSTFGMPTNLDWSTKAPTVNGYWDTNSSAYCNGNVSSNSDGCYRYNLTFNASINTIDTNNPTASLVFDNSELLATQQLTKTYQGDGSFRGGDWISRFTYVGEYNLDNESSTKFKDWWVNTYNQAKLYEYGTEYKGRITLSGIENPYWNRYGEGSTDGSNYKIHTDTDKGLAAALKDINNVPDKYRGLYIKSSTVSCEQPVVTGKWKVDTIAGTVS